MAVIPNGQKFQTLSSNVDTTERMSALINSREATFTMADITETVNAGGGSLPYSSLFLRISQSGTDNPTLTILSNDTDITFNGGFRNGVGEYQLLMNSGTQPDEENTMVLVGGYHSNQSTDYNNNAFTKLKEQSVYCRLGYNAGGGTFTKSDIGFGGTEYILMEIRVFS